MKKFFCFVFLSSLFLCPLQVHGTPGSKLRDQLRRVCSLIPSSSKELSELGRPLLDGGNDAQQFLDECIFLSGNRRISISSDDYQMYVSLVAKKQQPIVFLAHVMPNEFNEIYIAGGLTMMKSLLMNFLDSSQKRNIVFMHSLISIAEENDHRIFADMLRQEIVQK